MGYNLKFEVVYKFDRTNTNKPCEMYIFLTLEDKFPFLLRSGELTNCIPMSFWERIWQHINSVPYYDKTHFLQENKDNEFSCYMHSNNWKHLEEKVEPIIENIIKLFSNKFNKLDNISILQNTIPKDVTFTVAFTPDGNCEKKEVK